MAEPHHSSTGKNGNVTKEFILNAFVMNTPGHLAPGLWKHPRNKTDRYKKLSFWTDLAQLLDKANFHAMCIADTLGPPRIRASIPVNDLLYLVPAMAAVTKNLVFGVTASPTYEKPYALARRLSTVDHLSEGRIAWNIVTSYLDSAARNHGLKEQIPNGERYAIAHEYMDVLYKLWGGSFRDEYLSHADQAGALALFGGWTGVNLSGYNDDEDFRFSDSPRVQSIVRRWSVTVPGTDNLPWTNRRIVEYLSVGGLQAMLILVLGRSI
ncbi:xenobiotic compound monooxygenase DszA family [Penicillium alfredii]|uniref:Xenobiotic compound monooxygenase DszA family n=1 Tax=Penicillium alfredii TaxID=1506179 RepID=A0A9W9F2C4_9EURO|nr:xenobiotic compound monooxygenase DszA family [Penicillium alfredii]KAJ5092363.1 xenobiotic compound monooxygenase DszA family [Penicillium alfredii]